MRRPFLITGLPRSRTAWLTAAANTVADTMCLHEVTADLPRWQSIFGIWEEPWDAFHVGIADSALGFRLSEIIAYAAPRILIVERPQAEVEESLARIGVAKSNYCTLLAEKLEVFKTHPLVRHVAYANLADTAEVVRCMAHLLPGATICEAKIAALQCLNIQADIGRALEMAPSRCDKAAELFGPDVVTRLAAE